MFCKKCGRKLAIVKFLKNYSRKPLSYFTDYIGQDSVKVSIPLMILLLILYGTIHIIYRKCFVKAIIGSIKNIPGLLNDMNIVSNADAIIMSKGLARSNSLIQIEKTFSNLIDNTKVFFRGVSDLSILIIITIIVLVILNSITIKSKLKIKDILLISISSYIPLVISSMIAAIGTLISILFGICLIVSGYTLSFITLYNGIKDMSGERKDKVFIMMIILFTIISAVVSFVTIIRFNNSIIQIGKVIGIIKEFL